MYDCSLLLADHLLLTQFPIRETSTKALGRLLLYQIRTSATINAANLDILTSLVSALQDDSSEVRRKALSAIKAVAKVCKFFVTYPSGKMLFIVSDSLIHYLYFKCGGFAGKSFVYCDSRITNWSSTRRVFEGRKYSCKASCRKMCFALLPADKGYLFVLWFLIPLIV